MTHLDPETVHFLRTLQSDVQQLRGMVQQQRQMSGLGDSGELAQLREQVSALQERLGNVLNDPIKLPNGKYRNIEDIPGYRHTKWHRVRIAFTQGESGEKNDSVEISADGPFVVQQCAPYWQGTDSDTAALSADMRFRYMPPNILSPLMAIGGSTETLPLRVTDLTQATGEIVEFSFKIQAAGSGRFWAPDRIPGPAFFGQNGLPAILPYPSFIERSDRLVVYANAERTIPHDGQIEFVFIGYEITRAIYLRDMLELAF